jgi:TonB family protein
MLARAAALVQQERAAISTAGRGPLRLGGEIKEPQRLLDVAPVYPPVAQTARVEGSVIVEATVGQDGRVKDAKVIKSIPLLDQAALDAVQQWRFAPTLLNGAPVDVIFATTVRFPPNQPSSVDQPVRVGGAISEPKLLKKVNPVYPDDAREARLTGVVVIEAIIDRQGGVKDAQVLRSPGSSFSRAALDAVRQWKYQPTLLNGVPVEVLFTVTVVFNLK